MKKIIRSGFMLLLITCIKASAQNIDIPKNYHFNSDEDYARYEPEIIKIADWMNQMPWTAQPKKREAATQFFLSWVKGTPAVTVRLTESVMLLSDRNPELGFTYMAQYSKYALQHKADFDVNKATLVALRAMMAKYSTEPTKRKDFDVDRLIQRDKEGKLEDWVANEFYKDYRE
ncbi:hypothetical protein [Mucilaginibacter segetis]|uniref:Uncharacterized protein n=1 Tax=Mucilaginibacter segetis TaxID=2793071 RepID=A0A934PTW3_9SPHI|nr:hypothetical protein [Mucilaginibacter segetis]MBK0380749.1 hypothetical protein [Mucilaginibacter segetis]